MFMPSGSAPMTVTCGAGVAERLGRDARGRAVRAVEHDVDAVEAVRQRCRAGARRSGLRRRRTGGCGRRRRRSAASFGLPMARLDAVLDLVGQLHAAAREELDAVVGRGVVRRRDHHAEVGIDVESMRNAAAGVGMTPASSTSTPELARPADDGGGEELAGDAGVARDDGDRGAARRARARRRGGPGRGRRRPPGPGRGRGRR